MNVVSVEVTEVTSVESVCLNTTQKYLKAHKLTEEMLDQKLVLNLILWDLSIC